MAKAELRDHRKFLRLRRLLNAPTPHVLGYLECLWLRGYQTGSPDIGDALDVESAAEYPGEIGAFTRAALDAGFIDEISPGKYIIHDLYDHAPQYAKQRMQRRGTAPDEKQHEGEKTPQKSPNGDQQSPRGGNQSPNGDENPEKPSACVTKKKEERIENSGAAPQPGPEKSVDPPPQKKKRTSKPKPDVNPNHAPAVSIFTEKWQLKYGAKYPFTPKCAKMVANILPVIENNLETFAAAVDRYLADPDPFYAGHDLSQFAWRLSRWLVNPPAPKPRAATPSKGERLDAQFAREVFELSSKHSHELATPTPNGETHATASDTPEIGIGSAQS